jgi:hypothetical protein
MLEIAHGAETASASRWLALGEPPAPIAALSPARRNALIACFNSEGLHKKNGAWHGPLSGKALSGATVADLAREGMLTVAKNHRFGSAQLTERGKWFARSLLDSGQEKLGRGISTSK